MKRTTTNLYEVVYEHLADPRNFLGLQPLLVDISEIQESQVQGVKVLHYENVEAFRFGPLTDHNHIGVRFELTRLGERMDAHVKSPGGVSLHVEYHFQRAEAGMHLKEVMHIEAPRLLMNFVISQASQAQNTVFERLKQRMEAETRTHPKIVLAAEDGREESVQHGYAASNRIFD